MKDMMKDATQSDTSLALDNEFLSNLNRWDNEGENSTFIKHINKLQNEKIDVHNKYVAVADSSLKT